MAEIIAFNAKGREEEIAGEKAFVTSFGARNVGREFVLTRGRAAEMATPEEESIWTTWKAEMRRNLFFGSTLFIIIKEGGRGLQNAHHWELRRPLGQTTPGEGQHNKL